MNIVERIHKYVASSLIWCCHWYIVEIHGTVSRWQRKNSSPGLSTHKSQHFVTIVQYNIPLQASGKDALAPSTIWIFSAFWSVWKNVFTPPRTHTHTQTTHLVVRVQPSWNVRVSWMLRRRSPENWCFCYAANETCLFTSLSCTRFLLICIAP